jgi:hypothetical protein
VQEEVCTSLGAITPTESGSAVLTRWPPSSETQTGIDDIAVTVAEDAVVADQEPVPAPLPRLFCVHLRTSSSKRYLQVLLLHDAACVAGRQLSSESPGITGAHRT